MTVPGDVGRIDALLEVGQVERAVSAARAALAQQPGDPRLLAALARALDHAGDYPAAEEAARAAYAGGERLNALCVFVALAERREQWDQMSATALSMIEESPQFALGHIKLAEAESHRVRDEAGRAQVRAMYGRALELEPTARMLARAAFVEQTFGDRERCRQLAERGLAIAPTSAALLRLRSWAMKDWRSQASTMLGILAQDPTDAYSHAVLLHNLRYARNRWWYAGRVAAVVMAALSWQPRSADGVAPVLVALVLALLLVGAINAVMLRKTLGSGDRFGALVWKSLGRWLAGALAAWTGGAVLLAFHQPIGLPVMLAGSVVEIAHRFVMFERERAAVARAPETLRQFLRNRSRFTATSRVAAVAALIALRVGAEILPDHGSDIRSQVGFAAAGAVLCLALVGLVLERAMAAWHLRARGLLAVWSALGALLVLLTGWLSWFSLLRM